MNAQIINVFKKKQQVNFRLKSLQILPKTRYYKCLILVEKEVGLVEENPEGKQGKGEKWRRKEGEGRRISVGNKRFNGRRWERQPLV